MATISQRPDDLGTRALRQDNRAPASTRKVAAPDPSRAVRDDPGTAPTAGPAGDADAGSEHPARGPDRRQRQLPVLFDMRSGRERRQARANPEQARGAFDDAAQAQRPPGVGVDDYA